MNILSVRIITCSKHHLEVCPQNHPTITADRTCVVVFFWGGGGGGGGMIVIMDGICILSPNLSQF